MLYHVQSSDDLVRNHWVRIGLQEKLGQTGKEGFFRDRPSLAHETVYNVGDQAPETKIPTSTEVPQSQCGTFACSDVRTFRRRHVSFPRPATERATGIAVQGQSLQHQRKESD